MTVTDPALLAAMRHISELLQAGRFRLAHDQLDAIVKSQPQFVEALRLLAGCKRALGDPAGAEALLRSALALDPAWMPTLATLGELLLVSGRSSEAELLLARAAPGYAPAALLLARHYNDSQRPAQALAAAATLCQSGKADSELAGQHIAALAALGRQQEALALYRGLAAAAPDNPQLGHALAIALGAAHQHEEAAALAGRLVSRGAKSASLYNTYARSLIATGALEQAEAALRDCVALEPRFIDAQNNLAQLIWLRTGELGQATAEFDRALQRFDADDALIAAKAAVLQGAGDARAAYECLAPRIARAQPPPLLLVRAGLSALEFDAAGALTLAERALRALPDNAAARTLLTAAQLGVGDAQGALQQCAMLRARAPDDQYLIALETTAWRLLGDARYAALCDYQNLVLSSQLQPPPGWPTLERFLAEVQASLNRLHRPDGHPLLFQSLRHGTETSQDLLRSTDPVIQALFQCFAAPIEAYLSHIGSGDDPLRRRNGAGWRFNGSWSVRLRSSGHHRSHVHPRGWISSACYIALPDCMNAHTDAGTLTFGAPSIATNPPLAAEYSLAPAAGMLVLFPSYFWHGTVPFLSEQARLTVAFDAVPAATAVSR